MEKDDRIPDDVLMDILVLLPADDLVRFKTVAKSWYALIASSVFVAKHLAFSSATIPATQNSLVLQIIFPKYDILLSYPDPESSAMKCVKLVLPFLSGYKYVRIVGCCNGLLCASVGFRDEVIFLFNPATKQFRRLPSPPSNITYKVGHRTCLWFCYDRNTNDYKVVRFLLYNRDLFKPMTVQAVAIYSDRSGTWRNCRAKEKVLDITKGYKVVMNGVIHWDGFQIVDENYVVVSFEMDSGVLRKIKIPSLPEYDDPAWAREAYPVVLGQSFGVLVVRHLTGEAHLAFVDLWVMIEYGAEQSWIRQASCRLPQNCSPDIVSCGNGQLICHHRDENDEQRDKFFLFDPMTEECREIFIPIIAEHLPPIINQAYTYTPSLVPVRQRRLG